jgi:hypothetical protein
MSLVALFVLPGFHAKEFFKRDNKGARVKPYDGWTDKQAAEYLEALVNAVCSVNIYLVGGIVDIDAFNKYTKQEREHLTGDNKLKGPQRVNGAPTKPLRLYKTRR